MNNEPNSEHLIPKRLRVTMHDKTISEAKPVPDQFGEDDESNLPKHMRKEQKTKRGVSVKKEKKVAKQLNGRTTINSGATFAENDIRTGRHDIEHKYTNSTQYVLKLPELVKLKERTKGDRIPVFMIEFNEEQKFVVIPYEEYFNI